MKTFSDLEFKPHPLAGGTQATIEFENGYGVSVITGPMFYTSSNAPYELAVLYKDNLCYSTPITDDVIGHQTEEDITELMRKVQELKA